MKAQNSILRLFAILISTYLGIDALAAFASPAKTRQACFTTPARGYSYPHMQLNPGGEPEPQVLTHPFFRVEEGEIGPYSPYCELYWDFIGAIHHGGGRDFHKKQKAFFRRRLETCKKIYS